VPFRCNAATGPSVTTEDEPHACPGALEELSTAWTPHELDQFLHRGGTDFGDERVFFLDEREGFGPNEHRHPEISWPSFVALAANIVNELHAWVLHAEHPGQGDAATSANDHTTEPDPDHVGTVPRDIDERARLLRQQSHVVVVVSKASSVLGGVPTPLRTAAELAAVRGGALLFAPQPPAPRALEEWTTVPATDLGDVARNRGVLGSGDSQIRCSGDTTLMYVPWSPNWQVIEDRDLVVFALSLGSPYQLGRDRLLASSKEAADLDTSDDPVHLSRDDLQKRSLQITHSSSRLSQQIAFADRIIGHARGAAVIRPRRDRSLIEHVTEMSGVAGLQAAMTETRAVAADRLDDLGDMKARLSEAEVRRGQNWVERILLLVAVLGFVDVAWWFFDINNDGYRWTWSVYYAACMSVLLLVALVLGLVVFGKRGRRASPDTQTTSDSSSPSGS